MSSFLIQVLLWFSLTSPTVCLQKRLTGSKSSKSPAKKQQLWILVHPFPMPLMKSSINSISVAAKRNRSSPSPVVRAATNIPRRKIQGVFADKILDEAPLDTYPSLEDFTDYMLRFWIDDEALFPSSLWNHHTNTDERVNNGNEDYNLRFYTSTGNVPPPNIWK